jgi:hypothetical protein
MQASMTGDATAALNGFIAEFQELQVQFSGPHLEIDWYSPTRESFPCYFTGVMLTERTRKNGPCYYCS